MKHFHVSLENIVASEDLSKPGADPQGAGKRRRPGTLKPEAIAKFMDLVLAKGSVHVEAQEVAKKLGYASSSPLNRLMEGDDAINRLRDEATRQAWEVAEKIWLGEYAKIGGAARASDFFVFKFVGQVIEAFIGVHGDERAGGEPDAARKLAYLFVTYRDTPGGADDRILKLNEMIDRIIGHGQQRKVLVSKVGSVPLPASVIREAMMGALIEMLFMFAFAARNKALTNTVTYELDAIYAAMQCVLQGYAMPGVVVDFVGGSHREPPPPPKKPSP